MAAKSSKTAARRSYRQALIAKATKDPAYLVDKYLSLKGKFMSDHSRAARGLPIR
jgi:hypothetical protein